MYVITKVQMRIKIIVKSVIRLSPEHAPLTKRSSERLSFSEQKIKASISHMLQENVLCSMSTVTNHNRAHINTAYFSFSQELELYFLSDPSSLHCRNLSANPSMAMTIFNSSQNWIDPGLGLQLFGSCKETKGHHTVKAETMYVKRFPAYRKWKAGFIKDGQRGSLWYRFYRFIPRVIKILDEREFGDAVFIFASVKRYRDLK